MKLFTLLLLVFANFGLGLEVDPNGYLLYCPCMGRFGNQADHFLGSLAFAKGINRTLVLPPWVEYRAGQARSVQVPFSRYFSVGALQDYHRVMTMENFMEHLAPSVWPPEKRVVLCYMARHNTSSCEAKQGNPFGAFWDTYSVDFVGSSFYGPMSYDVTQAHYMKRWAREYSSREWPVLAFTGAPASFPVQRGNTALQRYLVWSSGVEDQASQVVRGFPPGPRVGLHLRNGVDWERACSHVKYSPSLFSSPQCLGYNNQHGNTTSELCLPSLSTIVKQTRRAVKQTKATVVFVATDHNAMVKELTNGLQGLGVTVVTSPTNSPHTDLAILASSHHFIGNCVSSFTAFVARHRAVAGLPTSFWAFPAALPPREEL